MFLNALFSEESSWFFNEFIFWYALTIMTTYVLLTIIASLAIRNYVKENESINFEQILNAPLAPRIAIIAPAFNESTTIIENVRSLLSLRYNNFEIVVVNDGSTDDMVAVMVKEFEMIQVPIQPYSDLIHKEVRGVYRSKNKALKNLVLVDKANGGKADALNAGINYTQARLVANIDVDCIIEKNALLRMVEPFLQDTDKSLIATGGVVRIANNCEVKNGAISQVRLSKKLIPLFQTVEYLRAFLLGRMSWSHMNSLLIVSGAFGLFDKSKIIEVGGYNTKTVGEDLELVFRMRKHAVKMKRKHRVHFIPDPLCWTEVPEELGVLVRQRNRWTRGCAETLIKHFSMFFNPKYGFMGLVSFPFWVLFEWWASLIEFLGLLFFGVLVYLGWVHWPHALLLFLMVYSFSVMLTWYAILMEELTFRKYPNTKSLIKLLGVAMLEPILYHPLIVYVAVKGNIDKFVLRKNAWGAQKRKGFAKPNSN